LLLPYLAMTTCINRLVTDKRNTGKLERWTKNGSIFSFDFYLENEEIDLIINQDLFRLDWNEYVAITRALRKNGYNWSVPY
jgi:hypothetical protein